MPSQELTPASEDALFTLYAVKQGLVSESAVDKALSNREDPNKRLREILIESEAISEAAAEKLLDRLDPEVIAGYRIQGEAGRGGMGVVYEAKQLSMDRVIALKVLSRRLSRDESYVAKFLDEARSAAKLNHENIVAAIDAGESNGLHYFVMEFVAGKSVADELDETKQPIPWQRTFVIGEQIARALEHAHDNKLVHRDVKPENIMISADGQAKLCDLGLAKPTQEAGTGEKSAMTEGTPYYCSPEQALGRTDIDGRSDIYSLGTTIYNMLAGEPPYDGGGARAIMRKQVHEPFPDLDLKLPDVPAPYRRLLNAMVVKDRDDRLPSMREFKERLLAARREIEEEARAARTAKPADKRGLTVLLGVVGTFLLFGLLGGAATLAVLKKDPEQAKSPTPTAAPPKAPDDPDDPDDPDQGGGITRVDPNGGNGGSSGGGSAEARKLYDDAVSYAEQNPGDAWGALRRYAKVADRYPESRLAVEAAKRADELQEDVNTAAGRAFDALTERVLALTGSRQFRVASELVDTFEATWGPRDVPRIDKRLETIRQSIDQLGRAALKRAIGRVNAGREGAAEALRTLAGELPESLRAAADEAVAAIDKREAGTAFLALRGRYEKALAAGQVDKAKEILDGALRDETLKPFAGEIEQAQRDVGELIQARETFTSNCQLMSEKRQVTLQLASGKSITGRLARFYASKWRGEFVASGERDATDLDFRTLAPGELLKLGLPPQGGRANARMFLLSNAPDAAKAALDAFVASGGTDDPTLRRKIERKRGESYEREASDRIDRLVASETPPQTVIDEARAFPVHLRGTASYKGRYALLKVAYTRAMIAQMGSTVSDLFKGDFKTDRKGRVVLTYTFANPAEAEDWQVDTKVDAESRVGLADGGLSIKGKARHIARFKGGDLKVQIKGIVQNSGAPNFNVVVGDSGGWTGLFCGAGFKYGEREEIKIASTAPKDAGYLVDLPANVLIVLQGRKFRRKIKGVMSADEKPKLKANAVRKVLIQRSNRGTIKMKVGSRTVFSVGPVEGWDAVGSVAFMPLSSEIVVQEVVITGELDEPWAAEFVQQRASQAAERDLPPPAN